MKTKFLVSVLALLAVGLFLVAPAMAAKQAKPKTISVYTWEEYLPKETLEKFQKETGIKVNVSYFASNEELLAKLQAGAKGYDVIMPSDYMVGVMIKLGLLAKLDHAKVPNVKSLDPKLVGRLYDSKNEYSLPYSWGTTGIAIHRGLYPKGDVKSWKQLFEDKSLAGKISLLDDPRETIGAALLRYKYSLNTQNDKELQEAKALLLQVKGRVKAFESNPMNLLTPGEVAVAHCYSSDAFFAQQQIGTKAKIDYYLPEEGCSEWIDNFAVLASSKHKDEAHAFINRFLSADSQMLTASEVGVAPSNIEAVKGLPDELRNSPILFPPEKDLKRCEVIHDIGSKTAAYDRLWTEVKASR
jgi:spermidine/putrescine transport system substrate-binding protein